jgi:hypothetical protein
MKIHLFQQLVKECLLVVIIKSLELLLVKDFSRESYERLTKGRQYANSFITYCLPFLLKMKSSSASETVIN